MDKNIAAVIALLGVFMTLKALIAADAGIGGGRPLAKRFMTARDWQCSISLNAACPNTAFTRRSRWARC